MKNTICSLRPKTPASSFCCFKEWLIPNNIFSFCICSFSISSDLLPRWARLSTWPDGVHKVLRPLWEIMAQAHTSRLTPDHLSAQVLFKTYMSYSWEHHPSLAGIANPSRLRPGSQGARGRPNLCLHYTRAIDYFPLSDSLPAAPRPLFRSHYGHTSSHSQPKWRLHSYINRAHLASIIILHLYCTCLPFWQGTHAQPPFRCGEMKLCLMLPVLLFTDDLLCRCDVEAATSKQVMLLLCPWRRLIFMYELRPVLKDGLQFNLPLK